MTDHLLPGPDEQRRIDARAADALLARALSRARWTIFWERLWPGLAGLATVAGLFLAASWFGLWLWLPVTGRMAGLAIFALAAAAAAYPLLFARFASAAEGLSRLDRRTGIPHRPATAMADELAANSDDQVALALWRAHVDRAIRAARDLRSGLPRPFLAARDPYAVRALVVILVVATFFAAGGERGKRLAAAFDWKGAIAAQNYRIDAWVTPPNYTGRPPVILPGLRPGEPTRVTGPVSVPVGSIVLVRATGTGALDIAVKGGINAHKEETPAKVPFGVEEHRYVVQDEGQVTLRGFGDAVTWSFEAVPDFAPTIAFGKDPEVQARGALQLVYKLEDDYGVTDAQARLALKPPADTPAARIANPEPRQTRPLYGPPDFPLALPQARTRSGVGQTMKEIGDHPWAGAEILLTLVARDEAGNEGRSEPFEMRLPERVFTKPMARALIELRRDLALDAGAKPKLLGALEALTVSPDRFDVESSVYLGLRSIFWQLTRSRSDDQLRDVVVRLWDMALAVEDGNISDVEAALRAAQEALRQALERGASEEEIKRLTNELRAAMDKFLQALAEEMRKNPQQAQRMSPNTRMLRSQDLKSMIDRMEQLAKSGAKDAAKKLLDELQQLLENLQMARPGASPGDQGDDDMMSALDELGDMIRKQQQLRDRTFREGQEMRRDRQRGSGASKASRASNAIWANCGRTSRLCAISSRNSLRS